jgi:hypothetical protein
VGRLQAVAPRLRSRHPRCRARTQLPVRVRAARRYRGRGRRQVRDDPRDWARRARLLRRPNPGSSGARPGRSRPSHAVGVHAREPVAVPVGESCVRHRRAGLSRRDDDRSATNLVVHEPALWERAERIGPRFPVGSDTDDESEWVGGVAASYGYFNLVSCYNVE